MIVLLLASCAPDPWTEEGAIAPTFAQVDRDHDGAISPTEWEADSFHAAPFAEVDVDKSGGIDTSELLAVVMATDPSQMTMPRAGPTTSKGKRPRAGPKAQTEGPTQLSPARARHERALTTRYALLAVAEEIEAADPSATLPTDDELHHAADSGDLRTAECRAILAKLEAAADRSGVEFPAPLRATALAKEEIVPANPPEPMAEAPPKVQLGPDGRPAPRP